MIEVRAVTSKHIHSMKPSADGWSKEYWENTIRDRLEYYRYEVDRDLTDMVIRREITSEEYNANYWHEVWSRVSAELGLNYTREAW